jgi:dipeptidyl-peptidase-4
MKSLHARPRLSLAAVIVVLSCSSFLQAQELKTLSFEQIFRNAAPRVTTPLPTISAWADDRHYIQSKRSPGEENARTTLVDAETGIETVYRDLSRYRDILPPGIDPGAPVATMQDTSRLMYALEGDLYLLDTHRRTCTRLTTTAAEEKNPTFSPDGNYVAFTRDNDLYAIDLATGREIRYTTDGSGSVYNGWASWVYYEEILGRPSRYRAFWWSPDSKHLAFYRFDETNVPVFPLFNANGAHGSLENTRYPQAGDPNPQVRVGIVPVNGGPAVWGKFNAADDQYFGPPFWTPDGAQLFVQWMNRGQDTLVIYTVDPASGNRSPICTEHQSSWVEWYETITFLGDHQGFLLLSDRDGWSHIYHHAMDGSLKARLTAGSWSVKAIEGVDELHHMVYFTAGKEASTRTDFYRVELTGKGLERLTPGAFTNDIKLSPAAGYFIATSSNVATPPRTAIYRNDGTLIRELGDSRTPELATYRIGRSEMFSITTPDGYVLPAEWTLPADFSPSRRYPVLISVYGGPNSPGVADGWKPLSRQWLAQEGIIQISLDHRGSGHFGKNGVALMHRKLGTWEMEDYAAAARWLRAQPFVDTARICITGGSYGGYVTLMAMMVHPELFTHGIADYAVTDWRLYDSHYTERYMGTPAENPDGYRAASVFTYAPRLRGVLRIDHGTLDDNVHMQNILQLVDTLENLNKHIELMIYPGGRHGWGGPKSAHLRSETYRFYYHYLLRKEFPEALFGSLDWRSTRRRP